MIDETIVTRDSNWRCNNCNSFMGKNDMWFEDDLCGLCVDIVRQEEEELVDLYLTPEEGIEELLLTSEEEELVDLFLTPDLIPVKVLEILESFSDDTGNTYNECRRVLNEIIPLGYSFEFGLDGEPFDLRKI